MSHSTRNNDHHFPKMWNFPIQFPHSFVSMIDFYHPILVSLTFSLFVVLESMAAPTDCHHLISLYDILL